MNTVPPVKKDNFIKRLIRAFNETDTNYIQPNRYNWAFMMQNTNTYESYIMKAPQEHQTIAFSPRSSFRIGPYLGWRWIFLGYTVDLGSVGSVQKSKKTEFELGLYASMIVCDLIYRRTGDDFHFNRLEGFGPETAPYIGKNFKGIRTNTTGINLSYIFNHKNFSYPAAYAQSTVQKKSCGTWQTGMAFLWHDLNFNPEELPQEITGNTTYPLSPYFKTRNLHYWDLSLSAGYGYNWVFKKNCLLNISVSPAIGYAHAHGNRMVQQELTDNTVQPTQGFQWDHVTFNCTGRVGLVWNNSQYFAGLSLIVHSFLYPGTSLKLNKTFGSLNFYVGLNFMKRKAYR